MSAVMTDTERAARCAWLRVEIERGQAVIRSVEPARARVALLQAELDELDPGERSRSESCARCAAAPNGPCLHEGTCARRPADAWREPHLACPLVAAGGRCTRRTA